MNSRKLADTRNKEATNLYKIRYRNPLYTAAVRNKSNRYANALIDEALALCGSPYFKLSNRKWSKEAINFLSLFT